MKHSNKLGNVRDAVLLFSGGLDSTTALYLLRANGGNVKCLGIDYGQKHRKELERAERLCELSDVEYRVADLSSVSKFLGSSALVADNLEVPDGHYASESMKITVVPNRNMMMISIAAAWALSENFTSVVYGAHAGDHTIYPDCRPEFIDALDSALSLCDWKELGLITPFAKMSKTEIVKLGSELAVPYAETWSCYKGGDVHCGTCGTCVERREAFQQAGVEDPTKYQE